VLAPAADRLAHYGRRQKTHGHALVIGPWELVGWLDAGWVGWAAVAPNRYQGHGQKGPGPDLAEGLNPHRCPSLFLSLEGMFSSTTFAWGHFEGRVLRAV